MGACLSLDDSRRHSIEIDRELVRDRKELAKPAIPTLLLLDAAKVCVFTLGPGDSGKTTCLRQFIFQHSNGFSQEERAAFVPCIRANVVKALATMAEAINVLRLADDNMELKAVSAAALRSNDQSGCKSAGTSVGFMVQRPSELHAGIIPPLGRLTPSSLTELFTPISRQSFQLFWMEQKVQDVLEYANEFNIADNAL
ncbi:guanine nucleotide binding protein, alpha subunit [Blyttiomyces helicus]|uniref:Guanine nucleotide binding protein, alpha subunit n=1 Tax=Blyttiomyces helicus TaxID=388810 RepID=A0A4P9WNU4_9FUNG|nr:guanine nucleotide binding protein, alpha subunit [Blyttiomyces helicus]|eukprot:RKO92436.1 guanine nucleotide binding protein, alpha subunit [Blyttiomyces helicus]